jgi:hypothetical protein
MSKLGKRLINAAKSAQAIAKGEADTKTFRGACSGQPRCAGNSQRIRRPLRHHAIHVARLGTESTPS